MRKLFFYVLVSLFLMAPNLAAAGDADTQTTAQAHTQIAAPESVAEMTVLAAAPSKEPFLEENKEELGGAGLGALIGTLFGPLGIVVGGGVGWAIGWIVDEISEDKPS